MAALGKKVIREIQNGRRTTSAKSIFGNILSYI